MKRLGFGKKTRVRKGERTSFANNNNNNNITHNSTEETRDRLIELALTYDHANGDEDERQALLQFLATFPCREIFTASVDGGVLACALSRAIHEKHVDVLQAFLNHGMDADTRDNDGDTPLIAASYDNQSGECVRVLLAHNANVDACSVKGKTPLYWASENGNTKVVEMLLQKNANPDLQSDDGWTALMRASYFNRKDIVQLLLDYNANTTLKNKFRKTALALADDSEIVEMLHNHVSTSSYVLK